MKIVDKRSLDAENLDKIEREILILQQLAHPFIVKLYEVIRTERFLYIVTEYVNNGELFGENYHNKFYNIYFLNSIQIC
jgi:serine/threonine protein kinase